MSELVIERVMQNLKRLRFTHAPEALGEVLKRAQTDGLSPLTV